MMKTLISIFIILACGLGATAQENRAQAVQILKKALSKCQKIENGSYEFIYAQKSYSRKDTIPQQGSISFYNDKSTGETQALQHKNKRGLSIANQSGFFSLSYADSSYIFENSHTWRGEEGLVFLAYTNVKKSFLQDSVFIDSSYQISYIGIETIEGKKCHRIEFKVADIEQYGQVFSNIKFYYLIDIQSFLPIQYETTNTFMGNEQYNKLLITKSDFNKKKIAKELQNFSPPAYFKEKTNSQPNIQQIAVGDTLTRFDYRNLPDYNINLDELKQEYILLDFWYTNCFPCLLALPFVDSLAQKYEDKNLFVLGINPYDTSATKISEFKKKKNINYPNILIDKTTAQTLKVYAYPTLAIVERKSHKVVYVQSGFNEEMKKPLVDFIDKNIAR